jgi:hypothetical protein
MGFRSAFFFVVLAFLNVIPAFAQQTQNNGQQLGQWCHSGQTDPLHGLYCAVIQASFVPQQGTAYATSIEVLDGQTTPIIGSLTFAPGPNVVPFEDNEDDNGNPICYQYSSDGNVTYDSTGSPVTVACKQYASYDITDWDITIGTTHLYRSSANSTSANSACGNGYSNSIPMNSNSVAYYLCGNDTDSASTGMIIIIVPIHFLMGGKNNGYTNLVGEAIDNNGTFWDTGLYLPGVTPNGTAIAALDPPSKQHGHPMIQSGVTLLHRRHHNWSVPE